MHSHIVPVTLFLSLLAVVESAPTNTVERWQLPAPTVRVGNQEIVGIATQVPDSGNITINKFLGVRFANQPERFTPASQVDVFATQGVVQATASPAACPQQFLGSQQAQEFTIAVFESPEPQVSEDCLFVNIFVPSNSSKSPPEGRAVLFWIYGGDLEFGDNSEPEYDGSVFAAEQDVIVVTINYRVNVFGFPNWDEIAPDKRNLGFLDQRLALNFVKDNILAFGGNPEAITIFGQSAGGYSVKQLLMLPPSPLSFRAAIMESEAAIIRDNSTSLATLAKALNCSLSEELECVRAASIADIMNTIDAQSLAFYPIIDNITRTGNVMATIESGKFARVPTILGTNGDEGSVFVVESSFGASIKKRGVQKKRISPRQLGSIPAPNATKAEAATLIAFQCPVSNVTQLLVGQGLPVYRYFFNASFPNSTPFAGAGAFHSAEIAEVFGSFNRSQATPQQISISKYMNKAWANFAKNPFVDPAGDWPRLGAASQSNILNIQDTGIAPLLSSSVLDAGCLALGSSISPP